MKKNALSHPILSLCQRLSRFALWFLTVLLFAAMMVSIALAAPELSSVFSSDAALVSGQDGWYIQFSTTQGGTLALQLLSGETGQVVADLGAVQVEEGNGRIAWNGLLPDGTTVAQGPYMVAVQLINYWGEESNQGLVSLHVFDSAEQMQQNTLDLSSVLPEEAIPWEEESMTQAVSEAVPYATSFWDMDPDAYDLTNPAHQQAIWDLMMQPIMVLDVGQTEHVYPTNQPNISRTPYSENTAGELHGQSQGVHILEEDTDGDGYLLIESYSNDGTVTENAYMESLDAQLIHGYVKESLLMQVQPSTKYALLVDKLRQKLYIFEDGRIIGELLISTGLNNEKQPYNETPPGEFITISRVGEFRSGTMISEYAIRINGGTLLHEVPFRYGADNKTKIYDEFEKELGKKGSHACIRVQRRANPEGQNMAWLWSNLELKTKVFIWDDKGREMYEPELPDPNLQLYRNPNGGSNYHLDANCSGVRSVYLPLTGDFTYGQLDEEPFKSLTPCPYCNAPARLETLYERYVLAAEEAGATIPENARALFRLD